MVAMLPATRSHKLPPSLLRAVRHDPHGDTVLAMINPREAAHLIGEGGAGKPNPRFPQVLQFFGNEGGGTKESNSHNVSGNGGAGGTHSGSGAYDGQGRPNAVAVAGPAVTGPRGPLGPTGDPSHTTAALGVGSDFQGAVSDYANNYTNDAPSRVAKFLTGFGLRKPNPNDASTFANGLAHTGVDPLGAALSIGGFFNPIVGAASKIYTGAKLVTGWDGPEVTLGDAKPGDPTAGPAQGFNYSGEGPQGRYGQGVGTAPGPQGLGNQTNGGNGGAPLLPPIVGNGGAALPAPTPGGSALPPISAPLPQRNVSPGQLVPVAGPSPYSWQRPAWMY